MHFSPPLLHFSEFFQISTNKIPPHTLQFILYKSSAYLAQCLCLKIHLTLFPTVSIV